jgi:hypothetical protein
MHRATYDGLLGKLMAANGVADAHLVWCARRLSDRA